ncbi:hypothetical protein BKA62DRAFT_785767 [Auriculariales sp. MPI-PUGE-AT-0066]|nr:hypothetical protein BKA62DRAFT_785767 [Auriculariales sp. MPI-PUGE-AT-0066]
MQAVEAEAQVRDMPAATPQFSSNAPAIDRFVGRIGGSQADTFSDPHRVILDTRGVSLDRRGATTSSTAISFARPGASVLGPPKIRAGTKANKFQVQLKDPSRFSASATSSTAAVSASPSVFFVYLLPANLITRRNVRFHFLNDWPILLDTLEGMGLFFQFSAPFNINEHKGRNFAPELKMAFTEYLSRNTSPNFPEGSQLGRAYQFHTVTKGRVSNAPYSVKPIANVEVPDHFVNYDKLSSLKILFGRPPNPKSEFAHTLVLGPACGDLTGLLPKAVVDRHPQLPSIYQSPHACMGSRLMAVIISRCNLPAQVVSFPDACTPLCPSAPDLNSTASGSVVADEKVSGSALISASGSRVRRTHPTASPERPKRRARTSGNSDTGPPQPIDVDQLHDDFLLPPETSTRPFIAFTPSGNMDVSRSRVVVDFSANSLRPMAPVPANCASGSTAVTTDSIAVDAIQPASTSQDLCSPYSEEEFIDRVYTTSQFFDGTDAGDDYAITTSSAVKAWQASNFDHADEQYISFTNPRGVTTPALRICTPSTQIAASTLIRSAQHVVKYDFDDTCNSVLRTQDVPGVTELRAVAAPWTFALKTVLIKPGDGVGRGAFREVIDAALDRLLSAPFWIDRGEWMVPNDPFLAMQHTEYLNTMRIAGFLVAMRLHHLGGPPAKLHPLVLIVIVLGEHSELLEEPETFCQLHPSLNKFSELIKQFPTDVSLPITVPRHVFSDYMDTTPEEMLTGDPALRTAYRKIFVASLLLGVKSAQGNSPGVNTVGLKALGLGFSKLAKASQCCVASIRDQLISRLAIPKVVYPRAYSASLAGAAYIR